MPSHERQIARSLALTLFLAAILVAMTLLLSTPAAGQISASERTYVSQTVDGTMLTVNYARPSARGREPFGALMPWGGVWAIPRPDRFTVTLNPESESMQ
jgi:hypothetical protein